MDTNIQKVLQDKASEVEHSLSAADYRCTYALIQDGINFTIFLAGRNAKFSLYYKPTRGTWSFYSVDEWANSEMKPRLNSLLGIQVATIAMPTSAIKPVERKWSSSGPSLYFEAALECFHILQPFAEEYIDFSIIYEQAKIGIAGILDDPRYTHFDQQALQAALATPPSFEFTNAKEYLAQCLTLCKIQIQL